ncbi:MAG: ABC transporter ATP-binding protein [Rhodospirillales bacterium]|nr:ABC transporter ATP-binding protein [Rhodospirillales bacterium]
MAQSDEDFLRLDTVTKRFRELVAVDRLSLEVRQGELFTLLGPSGCGKSTTLRMIAGLDEPDEGEISLRGLILVRPSQGLFVPSMKRNMGMVFQSYAIWPHLNVFQTIAYPLRLRKMKSAEIRNKVMDMISLVGLDGFADSPASNLSGGQQQRVALARALVYEPDVLLLDEPFSNLDVKLREQLRVELKLLQRRVGVTVILVTHDQLEALSLSDRIAVMEDGNAAQIGDPRILYDEPATPFVRDFLGRSDIFEAKFEARLPEGRVQVSLVDGGMALIGHVAQPDGISEAGQVNVCIRPEAIELRTHSRVSGRNEIEGVVRAFLFLGDRAECYVEIGGREVVTLVPRHLDVVEGQTVFLHFPERALSVWPN